MTPPQAAMGTGTPAAAVGAAAASWRDLADLLDVQMQQITGRGVSVAAGGVPGGADALPGQRITLGQPRHTMPGQHP
ncbi:hypothetical protein [Lentzea roselyniae]|uniref:hypothetical protein n=1 Tax=Lentzea roselyniae TaxID=531940 RepID=UPI0031F9C326